MAITKWTNLLLPRLPGAGKTFVEEEVKQVIDDFCRESTSWREMLYGWTITADDREITIYSGDGTQLDVVGIIRVYFDQKQLTPYSHAPWETTSGYPLGWTAKKGDPSTIVLSTIPTTTYTEALDAWVYLRPIDPVTITEDMTLLTDDFFEPIFDGVIGRFYSQPNKPYSDRTAAGYHLTRYRNGIRKARDMANRGFTGNAQNWTYPKFGR